MAGQDGEQAAQAVLGVGGGFEFHAHEPQVRAVVRWLALSGLLVRIAHVVEGITANGLPARSMGTGAGLGLVRS